MEQENDTANELEHKVDDDCFNNQCRNKKEDGYTLCKNCVQQFVNICTCDKTFITGPPTHYVLGKTNGLIKRVDLPNPIPEFFYTQLTGNLYHILGCRGCQHTTEISIKDNFNDALQASILSCVFQKVEENDTIFYEYLSDTLDPTFENYLEKNGIKIGNVAKIVVGQESETSENSENSENTSSGPSIEIPFTPS